MNRRKMMQGLAAGFGAAVEAEDLDVVEQVVALGVFARGEDIEKVGGGMAPVGLVDDRAALAVLGILEGEIDRDGQPGLPRDLAGHRRLSGRELGLDGKEVDAALVEGLDDALMRGFDPVIGDAEIGAAGVGFDGAGRGADRPADEYVASALGDGAAG